MNSGQYTGSLDTDSNRTPIRPRRLLVSMVVAVGVVLGLVSPGAAAPPPSEVGATLAIQVDRVGDGVEIVSVIDEPSGRTAKVKEWRLSLVEIIADDGRGGEGGVQVDVVEFATRDLPTEHVVVVDARATDYYVTLEAVSRSNGRKRTESQLMLVSKRISVDCTTAAVGC